MDENNLISLLSILVKAPSLILNINDNVFKTEFGIIEREDSTLVKITLHNGIVISVYTHENKDTIDNLFDQIRKSAEEFGIYILEDKLKKCYDVLGNSVNNNQSE
jgi:hypothetical protein